MAPRALRRSVTGSGSFGYPSPACRANLRLKGVELGGGRVDLALQRLELLLRGRGLRLSIGEGLARGVDIACKRVCSAERAWSWLCTAATLVASSLNLASTACRSRVFALASSWAPEMASLASLICLVRSASSFCADALAAEASDSAFSAPAACFLRSAAEPAVFWRFCRSEARDSRARSAAVTCSVK